MKRESIYTAAFITHIGQHERLIYKVCAMYAANAEEKKDLFQDIVLQAWSAYSRFRSDSSFGTWLYRIALNTAINHQRKGRQPQGQQVDIQLIELPETISPDEKEKYRLMHDLIGRLSDMEKALIMLYMDDYLHQQIAEIMGISTSNVGTKLGRIKEKLKKQAQTIINK